MKTLLAVCRHYSKRSTVSAAIALGLLSGASASAILNIIREGLHNPDPQRRWWLIGLFTALSLLTAGARMASSLVLIALGARSVADLQVQLSRKILGCNMRRLEEIGAHRLMVALTNDVAAITGAVTNLPVLFINVATVLGCLVYMAWLSWRELLIVLLGLAIGVPSYLAAMRAGSLRQAVAREVEDELFQSFKGATQGTKELKMRYARRAGFLAQLAETAGRYARLRVEYMRIFLGGASWGNVVFYAAIGVVLFGWNPGMDSGIKTGYVLSLLYLVGPLQLLLTSYPLLTQAEVSVQKVERLGISLTSDSGESGDSDPGPPRLAWKKIQLRDVVMRYPAPAADEPPFTLGPIDFDLEQGEIVFLAGGNGSGKTTLAKVLVGLYPPDTGEILFDGMPIDNQNRDQFRQHFAAVFSDYFLFETLLGCEAPDLDERARRYLTGLHLQNKVRIQRGRLSTIELSQGQRKRLALLIAFLEDAPIFVFDEWAADQDKEFRNLFYRQILPELRARGKTVLVISHDERYFHVGDRIVHLDYGKLATPVSLAEGQLASA